MEHRSHVEQLKDQDVDLCPIAYFLEKKIRDAHLVKT